MVNGHRTAFSSLSRTPEFGRGELPVGSRTILLYPPTLDDYIVVLVNDEYPNVNSASVNVSITFQYISLFNFLAFIADLAMLGIAIVSALLIMITRRKVRRQFFK
jgi:hypothetical protein